MRWPEIPSPATLRSAMTRIRRLAALERRGGVMPIIAFMLIPLTFATGMAIDYALAGRLQTKMNAAADAAALAGVTKPMMSKSTTAACNAARRIFLAELADNASGLIFQDKSDLSITIDETYLASEARSVRCANDIVAEPAAFQTPTGRVVSVAYAGASRNTFAAILGSPSIAIGGTKTARSTIAQYYQIAFMVDISNSMGIGGTPADIAKLDSDPTIKCAFACHDPNGTLGQSASAYCDGNPSDAQCRLSRYYCPDKSSACRQMANSPTYSDRSSLARRYGYRLKIDYVNDSIGAFVDGLKPKMIPGSDKFSVSISTFGTVFGTKQAATSDWETLRASAGNIDLEIARPSPIGYSNQGWTYTSDSLGALAAGLKNVGNGSSASSRSTFVILISDGVEDIFDKSDKLYMWNRETTYNYLQKCNALKAAGVTVYTIETAYPAVSGDRQYDVLVRDLPSRNGGKQLADVMRACASSSDRYFMADDGPAIQSAVNDVFKMIDAESARLSR